jgi:hypothetical protein
MFVLAVQLDQPRRQLLQRAGSRERAVDVGAAPSLRGDLTADQEFFAAAFENGFDGRRVFTGADEVG